jgi:hypothetical protein
VRNGYFESGDVITAFQKEQDPSGFDSGRIFGTEAFGPYWHDDTTSNHFIAHAEPDPPPSLPRVFFDRFLILLDSVAILWFERATVQGSSEG